jgi:hypothetical protein
MDWVDGREVRGSEGRPRQRNRMARHKESHSPDRRPRRLKAPMRFGMRFADLPSILESSETGQIHTICSGG